MIVVPLTHSDGMLMHVSLCDPIVLLVTDTDMIDSVAECAW